MRATAMGLGLAVLGMAGTLAPAAPPYGSCPPPVLTCNASFYVANPGGCWYGPNYCYRGPCLPPAPWNGAITVREQYEKNRMPAYGVSGARGYPPGASPLAGMMVPYGGQPGLLPPPPGTAVFPTHPFAPARATSSCSARRLTTDAATSVPRAHGPPPVGVYVLPADDSRAAMR